MGDLNTARAMIMAGEVFVEGQRIDKPGTTVAEETTVTIKPRRSGRFVSRGGEKLDGALEDLALDVSDFTCIDLGASTGGFTDCLLKRGAKRVFAVDVGRGQLDWSLQTDSRVVMLEGINARYLSDLRIDSPVDLVSADLSFISIRLILPGLKNYSSSLFLFLVKPQFEAPREMVEPGGLIRDSENRGRILSDVKETIKSEGFQILGEVESRTPGRAGNVETFVLFRLAD